MESSFFSSATRRKRVAASCCSSDQSPCFLTKVKMRSSAAALFGGRQVRRFLRDIGRHRRSPRRTSSPFHIDFHPVSFPALGGPDAIHRPRSLNAFCVCLIEEHKRLAT